MLNSLEAAVEVLAEAGAVQYTITQLPHFKQTAEANTSDELIDKFLKDWERLGPGIYKVDYKKSATDTRSNLCFRVSKTQIAAGAPGSIAGIGGPNDMIMGFQQTIWNLQTDMRVKELQDKHEKEVAALKAKYEQGDGTDVTGLLSGIGKIENILRMVNGKPPVDGLPSLPAVAGAGTPSEMAAAQAGAEQLTQSLGELQDVLGDEVLVATLQKLAAKGKANPEKLRTALGYIDML